MAGYIGSKAVNLSTTGADINGDANIDGDLSFRDNDKIKLGAGSDLQIYHNANNSYVQDVGTGKLHITSDGTGVSIDKGTSELMATFDIDGAVTLYHNALPKLATTSSGVDISGNITRIDGTAPMIYLMETGVADSNHRIRQNTGNLYFQKLSDDTNTATTRMAIDGGTGDISFYDSLGSSQSFFWDASAEALGIGTTSPEGDGLHIQGSDNNNDDDLISLGFTFDANSRVLGTIGVHNSAANTGGLKFSTKNAGTLAERMRIDSSGNLLFGQNAVIGQNTSDGSDNRGVWLCGGASQTVSRGGSVRVYGNEHTDTGDVQIYSGNNAASNITLNAYGSNSTIQFTTNGGTERMRIDSSGRMGIGVVPETDWNTSYHALQLGSTATFMGAASGSGEGNWISNNAIFSTSGSWEYVQTASASSLDMQSSTAPFRFRYAASGTAGAAISWSEAMRIDSSGNLLVGTTSVNGKFSLGGSIPSSTQLCRIGNTDYGSGTVLSVAPGVVNFDAPGIVGGRMRIDSSGNLLVGKTSTSLAVAGARILPTGQVYSTASGAASFAANRLSSDGNILELYKDTGLVGSIGSRSSGANLYIAFRTETTGDGCGLTGSAASDGAIIPSDGNGAAVDNHIDLGASGTRFDDIYATNGTIQTSDRNEKQDIEELSDAEQRVAVAAKGLLRKFRWKDAVTEKGDEARTHFGIIAQDLQAAFAAEGLDAGDYAMFISSTWTDEDTGEERTRMGVRYSELLAFIIGAL